MTKSKKIYKCTYCLKKSSNCIKKAHRNFCSEGCLSKFNQLTSQAPFAGQHIYSRRKGYSHHGIGDDEGGVIHYSGFAENLTAGPIVQSSLEEFSGGRKITVINHKKRKYSLPESILRAKTRLGEENYHLPSNNCEHFVNWCIDGITLSRQVDKVSLLVLMLTVSSSVITGLYVFAVSSSSGLIAFIIAAIFTDIEHAPPIIHMLTFVGFAGGVALAIIMRFTIQKDSLKLPVAERTARRVGRVAALVTAGISSYGGLVFLERQALIVIYELDKNLSTDYIATIIKISIILATALPALATLVIGELFHRAALRINHWKL